MNNAATRHEQYSVEAPLYMAFELAEKEWKLGFTTGPGQRPRLRTIPARDLEALQWEIRRAKDRFRLPPTSPVMSCYEAGRDGFWLHRYLIHHGVHNRVVDSSSIEVKRRRRRPKTDRLDANGLLRLLIRHQAGDHKACSVVHVPTLKEEDDRQLHRELVAMKRERTRHINRIKGLLAGQGVRLSVQRAFLVRLDEVRLWDNSPIPLGIRSRLEREFERLELVRRQIQALEAQREELLRHSPEPVVQMVLSLMRLKAIGVNTAWPFVMEFFAWRDFRNGREIGALSGLAGTPYQSGESARELGISKAGNAYVRILAIELAWRWLRYQPESEISRWYERRFGQGGSRMRRVGIVALARKILVALWHYLETGEIPDGAVLKPLTI
jgi:transposase